MTNFSRDSFESKWESIIEQITEIRSADKSHRICFLFYFTGHGCTFKESNMLTNMVMIEETDGFIPIEEKLRKLSVKPNVIVIGVFDGCRNTIKAKSKTRQNLPDFGQLSILFACKAGGISLIKGDRSVFTQKFIEYFSKP
jgi:hypothetical protein